MVAQKIRENIYAVGALDRDRKLFDELIPLPDGTSYNSYLIKGSEKVALLDSVDPPMYGKLLENLKDLSVKKIDYIIVHHGEQDHSGSTAMLLKDFPDARLVTNKKCMSILIELLQVPESKFIVVEDGETLTLGDKTLQFILTPWVHWPETMVTYLKEEKILFSCDFFGSHYATDELFFNDREILYPAAKRYFAEIMMPFRTIIRKNMERLKDLDIEIIAPSHGPLHRQGDFIWDAYKDWSSEAVKNEVVIPYVSMHGSTGAMVKYLEKALAERGITVKTFHLTESDLGDLAAALLDAATIVIGTPTILAGPHPNIIYAAYLVKVLRPKLRFGSIIGSFGWAGKTVEILADIISSLKLEIIEPVIVKGYPKESDFKLLDGLADGILSRHKEL